MTTDKPSRNEDEYFVKQDAELLRKQRAQAEAAAREAERKTHYMKCPKDGYDLTTIERHGVQVDFCAHCGGLWLDKGELELLEEREGQGGILGRIFGDVRAALGRGGSKAAE